MQHMLSYNWPGNVRELDHTMERAVLMARNPRVEVADLGLELKRPSLGADPAAVRSLGQALEELSLEQVEALLVRKALARSGGNVSQAAEALGLSRGALYRRMEKHGL